jgi:hypothetical protein
MSDSTSTETPTAAELTEAAESNIEVIHRLFVEGNTEDAENLIAETEDIIKRINPAKRATAVQITLRNKLKEARKVPSTEVATVPAAPVVEQTAENLPPEIKKLLTRGIKRVRTIAETNVKASLEIAELIFAARLSLDYNGAPDLNAQSWQARMFSQELFVGLLADFPEPGVDERADEIRDGVAKLGQNVRAAMNDVQVNYFRALDLEINADKRAPFAKILSAAPEGTLPSHALAAQYMEGGPAALMTRAEKMRARRELDAKKKEIAAKPDAELTDEEREIIGADAPDAGALVDKLIKSIASAVKPLDDVDTRDALSAAQRKAKAEALGEQIAKLRALQAELTA